MKSSSRSKKFVLAGLCGLTLAWISSAMAQEVAKPADVQAPAAISEGAAPAAVTETKLEAPAAPEKPYVPFEYHGYFRSGFGFNGEGGHQEAFGAPGAGVAGVYDSAKYRLGNETETWGEMILVNNWLNPEKNSATFKSQAMLAYYAQEANHGDTDAILFREAFVEAGNFVAAKPDLKVWAGQRYYKRLDVHIEDLFWLNMSGFGGGFDDLDVGYGKLALAYIGGSTTKANLLTVHGYPVKHNIDLRWYDAPLPFGKLMVWLQGSAAKGGALSGTDAAGADVTGTMPDVSGFAGAVAWTSPEFLGGWNTLVLQYGMGSSSDFTSQYLPTVETLADPAGFGKFLVQDSSRFRVLDFGVIQPSKSFSMMYEVMYQLSDTGAAAKSMLNWYTFGLRPMYHFNQYVALAFETAVDYVDSEFGKSDYLAKFTLAPTVKAGNTFFGRPEIRLYATMATWGDDFKGEVAKNTYGDDTMGFAFGVQAENWW